MRFGSPLLALGLALFSGTALIADGPAVAQGNQALVIKGGTLLDGNGGPPLVGAVIVVKGNRIAAVGAAKWFQSWLARRSSMPPANGSRPA